MGRRILPFGVLLLAFTLRSVALNTRPLWYDEAFAVLFAEKGFSAMLAGTLTPVAGAASDVHPVAYYTALKGWMQVFGGSPFSARLLSVFAGLLTVAVAYAIGRRLFNGWAATVGMLIVAVSPFQVYYVQETRMYAPLTLFCALTVLFFLYAARNTQYQIRNWLGLALSAALAVYMQNLAAFFLLAFGLSTLRRPKVFAKMAAAGVAAFALWLPWFLNLPGQFAKLQQAYWVTRPDFVTLLQTLLVYHAGEELVAARALLPLALFTAVVLPVFLGWQILKQRREASTKNALWLTALAVGTPLLLFLASLYQPVYIQRALLPASLTYSIALGWLLAEAAMPTLIRIVLGGLLAVTAIAGLWAHYTFARFPRPDFPAAVAFLRQSAGPGDVILHSNKLTFLPMHYYDRALAQSFLADPPGSGSDTLALPTQKVLGLFAVNDAEAATRGAGRVWFVIFDRAIEEATPEQHPHLAWLESQYALRNTTHVGDLRVYEFVKR
ncbi:MAG: glycosyltransferase family 39 protein [Chloroflexi bacterium]|nr:glycosyltransferase family 39 protein [Chloroflexota bacterium]